MEMTKYRSLLNGEIKAKKSRNADGNEESHSDKRKRRRKSVFGKSPKSQRLVATIESKSNRKSKKALMFDDIQMKTRMMMIR